MIPRANESSLPPQAKNGEELSAVQIQRRYLQMAEAHLHDRFMPPWAGRVCAQWRAMLDRLENGAPASVASMLDWAIKLCLFLDRAERRGVNWEPWKQWTEAGSQTPVLASHESRAIAELHQELCEIDTRFGQLGNDGIFSALERAGALTQHFPGVDNIEHAVANPPAIGRARLRGQCIQQFAGQKLRYTCGWRGVWDRKKNLFLDLAEPFAAEEKWQELPRPIREFPPFAHDYLRSLLGQVLAFYDCGNYEAAAVVLGELGALQSEFDPRQRCEYQRLLAWVQCRRGFLDAICALDYLAQWQPLNFSLINDYVGAHCYQGLIPPQSIELNRGLKKAARIFRKIPTWNRAQPWRSSAIMVIRSCEMGCPRRR